MSVTVPSDGPARSTSCLRKSPSGTSPSGTCWYLSLSAGKAEYSLAEACDLHRAQCAHGSRTWLKSRVWWPKMAEDAQRYANGCEMGQRGKPDQSGRHHLHGFRGPFPRAAGGYTHALVVIDKLRYGMYYSTCSAMPHESARSSKSDSHRVARPKESIEHLLAFLDLRVEHVTAVQGFPMSVPEAIRPWHSLTAIEEPEVKAAFQDKLVNKMITIKLCFKLTKATLLRLAMMTVPSWVAANGGSSPSRWTTWTNAEKLDKLRYVMHWNIPLGENAVQRFTSLGHSTMSGGLPMTAGKKR
jgi:hypothetical protein